MNGKMIGIILILVLLFVLVVCVYLGIRYLRKKTQEFSQMLFGTSDIKEGIRKQEEVYASTPKSVSGATSVYLPQIVRDFPEFHLEEMKGRAEGVLRSYLQSIHEENISILEDDVTSELTDKVSLKIRALQNDDCH